MTRRLRLAAALRRIAQGDEAANRLKKLLRPDALHFYGPKGTAEHLVGQLLACDPTPRGKYVPWLAKVFNAGKVRATGVYHVVEGTSAQMLLPEDAAKIREALSLLERFRPPGVNVMNLDWHGLDDVAERLKGEKAKPDLVPDKLPGADVVHDDGTYKVFRVDQIGEGGRISPADEDRIKSLQTLGLGTSWCTRGDYEECQAERYLESGPVYVLLENGRKAAQFHVDSGGLTLMDARDRAIEDVHKNAALSKVLRAVLIDDPAVRRSPLAASSLAINTAGGRFPALEPLIASNPYGAVSYARDVLKARWPEAEREILTRPESARQYAIDVLKARWPEAESRFRGTPLFWNAYARAFGLPLPRGA